MKYRFYIPVLIFLCSCSSKPVKFYSIYNQGSAIVEPKPDSAQIETLSNDFLEILNGNSLQLRQQYIHNGLYVKILKNKGITETLAQRHNYQTDQWYFSQVANIANYRNRGCSIQYEGFSTIKNENILLYSISCKDELANIIEVYIHYDYENLTLKDIRLLSTGFKASDYLKYAIRNTILHPYNNKFEQINIGMYKSNEYFLNGEIKKAMETLAYYIKEYPDEYSLLLPFLVNHQALNAEEKTEVLNRMTDRYKTDTITIAFYNYLTGKISRDSFKNTYHSYYKITIN
jgi:hypothetical protein